MKSGYAIAASAWAKFNTARCYVPEDEAVELEELYRTFLGYLRDAERILSKMPRQNVGRVADVDGDLGAQFYHMENHLAQTGTIVGDLGRQGDLAALNISAALMTGMSQALSAVQIKAAKGLQMPCAWL